MIKNMMHFVSDIEEFDAVVSRWRSQHPKLGLLAMLPEASKDKTALLQAVCQRHTVPLAGAIFPALIKDDQFLTDGLWLLGFSEMPFYALYEALPGNREEAECAAEKIAEDVRVQIDHIPDLTLFLLFDAMVPNISTMLDCLYLNLANRVHYAGVNAGSETFEAMPCLFDNTRIVSNGLLLMLLKSHRGAILEHGYHAPERTVYATSTEGNCISHIDWRPAFEVYQELVQAQYGVKISRENFYQHAVHYPFGIIRANCHILVRIPVMLSDDGSLFCVGEVPPNSVLTLLERPSVDSNETLRVLIDGLTELDGSPAGRELLLFYCAGRRMHLGAECAGSELAEFYARTRAGKIAGAVSLGEIGDSTLHGYPLFHNATLVALSL